jgi:O-antigen/teichoic acid export membrane protein
LATSWFYGGQTWLGADKIMSHTTLVKNAFANVCRGGAAALVMVLLPPFLTRILSKDAYGTWLLILQLSTYVSLLDFGIQTAVGRYVSHHNELEEPEQRDSIVSTSLALLAGSGALAMVGISILAWQLPNLFRDMPADLHQDAQLALMCVGCSLAVALPFSVFGGIFIGLQRYDVPAWIIGVSKLLGGVFVVLIANASHSIVMMAIGMGITNIGSGLWQFLAYRRITTDIKISKKGISKTTAIEISSYCFSLSIWTIGMILVTGLDTTIIGYFDYQSVVYYSLAATLTSFVTSLHAAVIAVIMPNAAAIGAKKDRDALGKLLISTTRYGVITLILTSLPLVLGAQLFLSVWVGKSYASHTALLLQLLVIANFIRYIGAPYATIVLAVGAQRQIVLSPLVEGVVNVIVSIILTARYGVIGVAIGTLFGSFVSIGMHFVYNLPRTISIRISDSRILIFSIVRPLVSIVPSILFWWLYKSINLSGSSDFTVLGIASAISWFSLWKYGIFSAERKILKVAICARFNPLKG